MFGGLDFLLPICQVCGVQIHDLDKHQGFHDALSEIAHKALAPELSDEEWREGIQMWAGWENQMKEASSGDGH